MHICYADLGSPRAVLGGSILEYPTRSQDCRSLKRFARRTVDRARDTLELVDESSESFWFIVAGAGMMTLGDERFSIQPRDLILILPGVAHALEAGDEPVALFDFAFHSAVWEIASADLEKGVGDPHSAQVEGRPALIRDEMDSPRKGRYPHARPHSTLDHWDQNISRPGTRAADHVHPGHEEFWYIHEGSGDVEQDDQRFAVAAGDLVGHAPGVHHTLVAGEEVIRWYCFCLNRWLMPLVGTVLDAPQEFRG
jgi:mannose-6-phosphate isomerase-like protein (cupin superfamily)